MIWPHEATNLVDEAIDQLFAKALGIAGATSGDITPEQDEKLERLKEELSTLLFDQVNQNVEKPVYKDGIYTRRPSQVKAALEYAAEHCLMPMQDVSYGNDVTDSIGNEFVSIYLPNSSIQDTDAERFNTYVISVHEDDDRLHKYQFGNRQFETLEAAIYNINQVVNEGIWPRT